MLHYCSLGWSLLPLWEKDDEGVCVCRERERCTDKHPRIKWQNPEPGRVGATCDPAEVRRWHLVWPNADWAVVLVDFFVVDVDRKHGGLETLARVQDEQPELLDITLVQETPSGGRQFFFTQPAEGDIHTLQQGRLAGLPGFEIKGLRADGQAGSYVGIPPSRGRTWLNAQPISEASPFLLQAIRKAAVSIRTGTSAAGSGEAYDWALALTPGGVTYAQDDALYRAALSLRALDVPDRLALPLLRKVVDYFVNTEPSDPWQLDRADAKWRYVKDRYQAGKSEVEFTEAQRLFAERLAAKWSR